jgi:integrase
VVALPEHVHRVTAKGKTYLYYHQGRGTKNAGKRVRLPDDPNDATFWEAYTRLSGQERVIEQVRPFTFSALIEAYKASPEFARKKQSTKNLNLPHLQLIEEIWGPRLVRGVRAKHVLQLRDSFADTPRKADHLVSMLSTIIAWGVPRDYADVNPCREIGTLFDSAGWIPWDWQDIEYAADHLKPHLWQAAALALYTGQRLGDTLNMTWGAIKHGEISVVQSKTRKRLWIPLHRDLQAVLDGVPKLSVRILTNSRGKPWSSGFKAAWQDEMNSPPFASFRERRLVFHGLRKSAVVMLLEAGCTDAEVAAITGQSRDMIAHYSIMVNQRKLARAAILKWESANGG